MPFSITDSAADTANTTALRSQKKLYAKNDGSFESAIISAGYYAKKMNKTMFVYLGNSYGHSVWRVSYKPGDYLNVINNSSGVLLSVDPNLTVERHKLVKR